MYLGLVRLANLSHNIAIVWLFLATYLYYLRLDLNPRLKGTKLLKLS
jgi:hypothetical protein